MSEHDISVSRRTFVRTACIVEGATLIGESCSSRPDMCDIAAYLTRLLVDHDSAKRIGAAYLKIDSTVRKLSLPQLTRLSLLTPDSTLSIGRIFRWRRRGEFLQQRCIMISWWKMSCVWMGGCFQKRKRCCVRFYPCTPCWNTELCLLY